MHVAVEGFSSSFCKPLQRLENYYCSLKVWLHSEGATQETAKNTLADSSFGFAHKPRRYVVNEFVIGGNGFASTSRVYSVEELTVTMATHATSQPTPLTPGQRSQCEGPGNWRPERDTHLHTSRHSHVLMHTSDRYKWVISSHAYMYKSYKELRRTKRKLVSAVSVCANKTKSEASAGGHKAVS